MSQAHSKSVQSYYEALGFEVPYSTCLEVRESIDIINVSVEKILTAFRNIDRPDVDTFLHVGGTLGVVDLIDDLESMLGRPVVSVNAAT